MYPGFGGKRYIYPDGTYGANKPKDGQVFYVTKNGQTDSTWQWDDVMSQWCNISSGKPTKANTASFAVSGASWEELERMASDCDLPVYGGYVKKCECGSEKVGSAKHSTWCQLYDSRS